MCLLMLLIEDLYLWQQQQQQSSQVGEKQEYTQYNILQLDLNYRQLKFKGVDQIIEQIYCYLTIYTKILKEKQLNKIQREQLQNFHMKLLSIEQSEPQQNECQTKNQQSEGKPLPNNNDQQLQMEENISGLQFLNTSNAENIDLIWLVEVIKRQKALEKVSKAKKIKKFQLKLKRKQPTTQMRLVKKIAMQEIFKILQNE
ncbi:unnamed protein product [Paramecium octaurelia]|uniref:Uncharacterized protein n=1 Tax=Paramecium octaurelia TaxID=43137 RepID=A0A8S1VRA7_PAROT|nr:unnamed protein product [Paramecium octaurelia]